MISFALVEKGYSATIDMLVDGRPALHFAELRQGGMGHTSDSIALAHRIVDWLNSQPQKDVVLYPYERDAK